MLRRNEPIYQQIVTIASSFGVFDCIPRSKSLLTYPRSRWMRQRFDVETGQLWSSILLFHSADESNAIERFFSLFQEFIDRKNCREDKLESIESRMTTY
jgi:hypothetical protein